MLSSIREWFRRMAVLGAVPLVLVAARPASIPEGGGTSPTAGLSTAQLAGQRVILSYSGLTPPATVLSAIRHGEAAGVIFFGQNISSRSQIRAVAAELQRAAAASPVKLPLLLMTDQEGGLVRRLPGAPSVSEKQVGQAGDAASVARRAGRGAGLNLRGAGLNVNLAPVLDVYRRAGNFIDQYGRSYSSNPTTVATLGADFIAKQQAVDVAATAKHFPGLGAAATAQNTDAQPVTLNLSLGSLRAVDELPYRSAIRAGVKLVMLSWARYPALDPRLPAGLSSRIVSGELRRRLRFRGVTITDALEAGALKGFGGTASRALRAAGAGMDLLLCSAQDPSQGTTAVQALAEALHARRLGRSAFLASVARVMALRRSLAG